MNRNSEFNYLIDSLKQSYGINYLSNDIMNYLNNNIFSNQEFIKVIYKEYPSLFKRMFNTILLSFKDNIVTKDILIEVKSMWNKVDKVWSKIKVTKGNIPIDLNLLNKYPNVEEIFANEIKNYNRIVKIGSINVETSNKIVTEIYHLATEIFNNNHFDKFFYNKGNKIYITNQYIKESVNKLFNDNFQKVYIKQHLSIIKELGKIIEKSLLINQTIEAKGRNQYNTWNYYYAKIVINKTLFSIVFDVVSRLDGQNHYRIQRIEKADIRSTLSKMD